ncbi:MAG: Hsp33 family molecular chaperone HslO [Pseudomonadota bacterium]
MLEDKAPIAVTGTQGDWQDSVLPFSIEAQDMRGRLARLGPALNQILAAHAYPPAVAALLAEMLALTALLGAILKRDGILTLQAKGKAGPVRLLVCDFREGGALRGYAQFDADAAPAVDLPARVPGLLGTGHLALTLEQDGERYQGIVALEGETLADCARGYFERSEQTPTVLKLAAMRDETGWWRAGGLMLQHLAPRHASGAQPASADHKEDWRRVSTLMTTVRDTELNHASLASTDLLYRLFHEEGVRVYEHLRLTRGCRCSRASIAGVLARFSDADLADMVEDGAITVTCEFCNKGFRFAPDLKHAKNAGSKARER